MLHTVHALNSHGPFNWTTRVQGWHLLLQGQGLSATAALYEEITCTHPLGPQQRSRVPFQDNCIQDRLPNIDFLKYRNKQWYRNYGMNVPCRGCPGPDGGNTIYQACFVWKITQNLLFLSCVDICSIPKHDPNTLPQAPFPHDDNFGCNWKHHANCHQFLTSQMQPHLTVKQFKQFPGDFAPVQKNWTALMTEHLKFHWVFVV